MRQRQPFSALITLLLGCCLAAAAAAGDQGSTWAQARSAAPGSAQIQVLWVASPGWAQRDDQGQPTGISIELMRRFGAWLSARHDLEVRLDFVEEADWRRFYGRVRDARGGVFGLGNVTITEARRQELAFSPPYVHNIAVLISAASDPELTDPARLPDHFADLRAMAFSGTLHEARLRALARDHWPELPMDFAGSNQAILDAVAAGSHFAYVDAYAYHGARAQGLAIRRHPVMDDGGESFGIIMPLNSDWQPLLAAFFDEGVGLLQSPWYRALVREHQGEELGALLLAE